MAADIESALEQQSELIQSSGGVFEVEYDGKLVFSKKAENRFPEDGEVITVVKQLQAGVPLEQAREEAARSAKKPPSFVEWFSQLIHRR